MNFREFFKEVQLLELQSFRKNITLQVVLLLAYYIITRIILGVCSMFCSC